MAGKSKPSKGAAFDKAAGIVLEIRPEADEHVVTVKATDLEVTYLEWITPLEVKMTEPVTWRMPHDPFSPVLSGLPIGADSTVTLTDDDTFLTITSGKKRAKLNKIDSGVPYMQWDPFDESYLEEVPEFSQRVAQVAWACHKQDIPFTGIRITGDDLIATDKYRLGIVPCKVPVAEPITVPLGTIAPTLRNLVDARLAATERRLLLMPNEYTQVTAVIYDNKYPDTKNIEALPYTEVMELPRELFKDAIQAMMNLCKSERYPRVCLTIGDGLVQIDMDVPGVGEMTDEVEALKGAEHEPVQLYFTPTFITDVLGAVSSNTIEFHYDPSKPLAMPKINDGTEFQAWIAARKPTDTE
jgi:DNA polymerase III sliding clamp (beta) subunit (PCNA family)